MSPSLLASRLRGASRPRSVLVGALALVLVLVLAGCSREPTAYTDSVRNNFVKACQDGGLTKSVCTCTFASIKKNIDFKDFKSLQSKLRDQPKPIDQVNSVGRQMLRYRQDCEAKASS